MLSRNETAVSVLRMLLSELKNTQIQKSADLSDQDIITVVQKEIKKRKEAAAGFRSGGREDSAQKEESEAKVLESYLPEQISDEELTKTVTEAINEIGATSMSQMGQVMSSVMVKVGQGAEGSRVSAMVKEQLQKN